MLPGFIDLHVHLGTESSPAAYLERFTENPADLALRAAAHARRTLHAGFTTVRESSATATTTTIALRDAIGRGLVEGPRIFSAGKSIATTGGHADPTNGWCDLIEGDPGPKEGVANGADEMRKAVRQRYKDRADLIKVTATGGVLSLAHSADAPQFDEDELAAVANGARLRPGGCRARARCRGDEASDPRRGRLHRARHPDGRGGDRALRRAQRLVRPTLLGGDLRRREGEGRRRLPRRGASEGGPHRRADPRRLRPGPCASVPIAFGTDAGVGPRRQRTRVRVPGRGAE